MEGRTRLFILASPYGERKSKKKKKSRSRSNVEDQQCREMLADVQAYCSDSKTQPVLYSSSFTILQIQKFDCLKISNNRISNVNGESY